MDRRSPQELRDRRTGAGTVIAGFLFVVFAPILSLFGVFVLLTTPPGSENSATRLVDLILMLLLVLGMFPARRVLPEIYDRARRRLASVAGRDPQGPVETGRILLAVELSGTVAVTSGAAGAVVFHSSCRVEPCDSLPETVGLVSQSLPYLVASLLLIAAGTVLLAFGWVAEGLSVTADNPGDSDSSRFP